MTEYTMRGDEPITEITDWDTRNRYFKLAREQYMDGKAYSMTFLPVAEGFYDMLYPLVQSDYERQSREDTQAYSYIMQKTLEETFKRGNPQHDSNLIIRMSKEDVTDRHKANIDEWRALTLRAVQEQMRKDSEWFGKLTPAAQLTAIGMELHMTSRGSSPRLQYEEGLKFDFGRTEEGTYSADLSQAANMILPKAYRRNNERAYPLEDSQLTWEVKAAALEAQLKSHGGSWKEKIPSLPVFVDLLKTAEKPAQQLKLAELAKEPDFKESMRYDSFRSEIRNAVKEVAPCGEATQKLFYEILYNLDLRGINEPKLQLGDINFSTLQAAVAECKAQRSVDVVNARYDEICKSIKDFNKKLKDGSISKTEGDIKQQEINKMLEIGTIINIDDLDLVAKYRPEFLEQPNKMIPRLCAEIMNKYSEKLSPQTQLEMMTKMVASIERGLVKGNGLDEQDYKVLVSCVSRATALNTSSKAMGKFLKTLQPVVEVAEKQYAKDKQYLANAAKAKAELRDAERDKELFDSAYFKFIDLSTIKVKIETLCLNDDYKCVEPNKDSVSAAWEEIISGKEAKLQFEPRTGLGRLMMNKNAKKIEQDMQDTVAKFNSYIEEFALSSEFKYIKEVSDVSQSDDKTYLNTLQQKENNIAQIKREMIVSGYNYASGKESRVVAYEKYKIADKFAALKERFEQRRQDMQGRARTDLAMQFGGQEFDGKPLEGLVKEEKMAQGIYKAKIAKLRHDIKDGVKQDMTDRGVNEKPSLDNPNEVGKPMTKENTAKIRKNMKDLKQYKQLVKE